MQDTEELTDAPEPTTHDEWVEQQLARCTEAEIEAWFSSLSDEAVDDYLDGMSLSDIVSEVFTSEDLLGIADGIPDEWWGEIERAYAVFGANEFAPFGGMKGFNWKKFLSEKATDQLRDPKGKFRKMVARIALKAVDPHKSKRSKLVEDAEGNIIGGGELKPEFRLDAKKPMLEKVADVAGKVGDKVSEKVLGKEPKTDPFAPGVRDPNTPSMEFGRAKGTGAIDDPIDVEGDYERAVDLMAEGKHIRVNDDPTGEKLRTVVQKIGDKWNSLNDEQKAKLKYNLCLATVPNSSVFCRENIGKPRVKMPQTEGRVFEGSLGAKYHSGDGGGLGGADVTPEFHSLLNDLDAQPQLRRAKASQLTASQSELDGTNLAQNMAVHEYRMAKSKKRVDKMIEEAPEGSKEREKLMALRQKMEDDRSTLMQVADFHDWKEGKDKLDAAKKQDAEDEANGVKQQDGQTELLDMALKEAVANDSDMASIIADEHEVSRSSKTLIDKNGYIVDGHHRWATDVLMNGDGEKLVEVVPMDIGEVLDLSTALTQMHGIMPAVASAKEREDLEKFAKDPKKVAKMAKEAEADLKKMIAARTDWTDEQVDEYMEYLKSDPKTREAPPWLQAIRAKNANARDEASHKVDAKRNAAIERRKVERAKRGEELVGKKWKKKS